MIGSLPVLHQRVLLRSGLQVDRVCLIRSTQFIRALHHGYFIINVPFSAVSEHLDGLDVRVLQVKGTCHAATLIGNSRQRECILDNPKALTCKGLDLEAFAVSLCIPSQLVPCGQ